MDSNRVFAAIMSTGIFYTDKTIEKDGDYARLGSVSFATLEIKIEPDCPQDIATYIQEEGAKLQKRKGEAFQISTSGQTITLGHRLAA